jgi:CheY-like chemotaxis protein
MKALIVDDSKFSLDFVGKLLEQHKMQVETANNGNTAIEKIRSGNVYDVIFMDFFMPDLDGLETAAKLRELGYEGKIVMLTSNETVAITSEDADKYGFFDKYLSKPIETEKLEEIIKEIQS